MHCIHLVQSICTRQLSHGFLQCPSCCMYFLGLRPRKYRQPLRGTYRIHCKNHATTTMYYMLHVHCMTTHHLLLVVEQCGTEKVLERNLQRPTLCTCTCTYICTYILTTYICIQRYWQVGKIHFPSTCIHVCTCTCTVYSTRLANQPLPLSNCHCCTATCIQLTGSPALHRSRNFWS